MVQVRLAVAFSGRIIILEADAVNKGREHSELIAQFGAHEPLEVGSIIHFRVNGKIEMTIFIILEN